MVGYKNTSTVSGETFAELKYHLIHPRQIRSVIAVSAVVAVLLVLAVIQDNTEFIFMNIILLVIIIAWGFMTVNQTVKTLTKQLQGATESGKYSFTITLGEDGITVLNNDDGIDGEFLYADFAKLVETKSYYALFTKNRQFMALDRAEVNREDKQAELLSFIKEKCPGIKLITSAPAK